MGKISLKIKEELDNIISIANQYSDGTIGESFFTDVLQSLKKDPDIAIEAEDYLNSNDIRIVSDNLAIEVMDDNWDSTDSNKIKPYDPSKIDISPKTLALTNLLSRIENDEIDLMPDFQRRSGLWSSTQKSQLIESLILRIPLPAFYFDGTDNDRWIIIDGLQRLTALKEFFINKTLSLTGLEFLQDLNNVDYDHMPKVYIRRMQETQVICYIINPGAPVNLKYNIFKRINTGGLELEPQEIRHALFQGFSTTYLKQLADSKAFLEATGYSVPTDRMLDREFVLRFIAFFEFGADAYNGSIDEYLNKAMVCINQKYGSDKKYADEINVQFINILNTCYEIFGKFAFRRMPDMSRRRSMSKALFETWTSVLARLPNEHIQTLKERKTILCDKYMPMFVSDEEFFNSIGSGKTAAVRKRFGKIEGLVKEVLASDS